MKRMFVLILCILLCGSVYLGLKQKEILETADQVTYEEEILYGSSEAIDGLVVEMTTEVMKDRYKEDSAYLWNTVMNFKNGGFAYEVSQRFEEDLPDVYVDESIYVYNDADSLIKTVEEYRKKYAEEIEKTGIFIAHIPERELYEYFPLNFYRQQIIYHLYHQY